MLIVEVAAAIIATRSTEANRRLASAGLLGRPLLRLAPGEAVAQLEPGDVALARLDVRPTLDGVEDGLDDLRLLEDRGVLVLNRPHALLAAHDKLLTARLLEGARLPHPRTYHVTDAGVLGSLEPPLVIKPRFGSWGRDVELCTDSNAVARCLDRCRHRTWFRRHGAIAQELVRPCGRDLRVLVAGRRVIGAVERIAPPGEWRTNVALGAFRRPIDPPAEASLLALAAADVIGGDLVGVDLLPDRGRLVLLEANGAVEFNREYFVRGDVFGAAAAALDDAVRARRAYARTEALLARAAFL
jgi:RimK family alpha-L-glutamate ligase